MGFQVDKLKLSEDIEKHVRTTFIGAIAAFERKLGFLWGIDKPFDQKTENEKKWFDVWNAVRSEILDFGNHQMRSLLRKLENGNYDI